MINIVKIYETCSGCPSQWEAKDSDGRFYYFRYRWGALRVTSADSPEDWKEGLDNESFYANLGDPFDGFMTYEELQWALIDLMTMPDTAEKKHEAWL